MINPKTFTVGKDQLSDFSQGEKKCYILANGLGGYSSLTAIGSATRRDHGLFISARKAPNYRVHLVTNLEESLISKEKNTGQEQGGEQSKGDCCRTDLYSQQFATKTSSIFNGKYLNSFEYTYIPQWSYKVGQLEIIKEIVYVYGENTVAIRYRIFNYGNCFREACCPDKDNFIFSVVPLFRLTNKDSFPSSSDIIKVYDNYIENETTGNRCYFAASSNFNKSSISFYNDMFFEYDSRDGRECIGKSFKCGSFDFEINPSEKSQTFYIIFSDKEISARDTHLVSSPEARPVSLPDTHPVSSSVSSRVSSPEARPVSSSVFSSVSQKNDLSSFCELFNNEIDRQKKLIEQSCMKDSCAQSLVLAADKFITYRKSTAGKTIIAGYPFFGDWGRDTMIAMAGCVLSTHRYEDAKSILRTFKSYEHNGMMPNVFPEGENDNPMYNTVDASLLFINAVYEYYIATDDISFVSEMFPVMENIIYYYRTGTEFHIKMDSDGLITAGAGLEQLTWMDVRFGDILPTPRQGKAVEINSYWYNALCIMDLFAEKLGRDKKDYLQLAENKVKPGFIKLFWNNDKGCFRDVISNIPGQEVDNQIRPNQVWALSMPFTMVSKEMAQSTLSVIYSELYTPWGLRSLSPNDSNFHKKYGGSHFNRDMAYHQGTVWCFPLGAYYISVMRFCENGKETVRRLLKYTETSLNEGCLGQLAEIYDGENPWESQGCFAQAWSVGEILRCYNSLM